jgi:demethylmenaquinone methyltransferase/2-methoxy-6-polyprenyl-1,4-benzoquinol methylase
MKPVSETSDEERIALVRKIFSAIPGRYDFLNHFLSMRRDIAWRRFTVRKMRFFNTNHFLDIATGTADLAIEAAKTHPGIRVTGMDFVPQMMEPGLRKVERENLSHRVSLVEGDALDIPFDKNAFDVAAIAFGIRNIPDKARALGEMARVVTPGGQVMVLELTTPQSRPVRALYGICLNSLFPIIGKVFSGNLPAYRYLAESIMDFPSPDRFSKIMEQSGLKDVRKYPLSLGAAHLHTATVA